MVVVEDKKNCSGCQACENICPVKAIRMKEDAEGDEDKRHQPPHFAVEQGVQVEGKKADGVVVVVAQDQKQIDDHCADDDDLHQVGDAEVGMPVCELVNFSIDAVQGKHLRTNVRRRQGAFCKSRGYKFLFYMIFFKMSLQNCKQRIFL